MNWEALLTLGILVAVVLGLVFSQRSPDVLLVGGLSLLTVLGIVSPAQALSGLSNEGVVTIVVLFAVATGLRETGAMNWFGHVLLGRSPSMLVAQSRIMFPVAGLSAFMNNTPLVGILLPVVDDWARRNQLPVSKLLIPLSYASILGGACTLIGTSTNLVVNGWLIEQVGHRGLGMFELAWVGVPCAVVGIGFIILTGRWLLPDRLPPISPEEDPRSYTVETLVQLEGPLIGKTIGEAGLRNLPGLYLMEIERGDETIPAVAPTETLHGGDRLVFVGVVDSVVDLHKIRGLVPAPDQVFKLATPRSRRTLIEAVVSDSCPMVGQTIREGRFRTHYNAVVIAVARSGRRIPGRIGDISLIPGDTLLLEALPSFVRQRRNSRDFFLISQLENSRPPGYERAPIALAILAALVVVVALGWLSMLKAALAAAGLMLMTRCCTATAVRRTIDWQMCLAVAATIGIGRAMQASGLADILAGPVIAAAGGQPRVALGVLYALSMVLSALIGAKAGAVLVLPLVVSASATLGVSLEPLAMGVLFACATTLATPIGYPTNLMVYGPGGYHFTDYLRLGVPISLLLGGLCVWLIPLVWPF